MKIYSDLQDINQSIDIKINLRPVGLPNLQFKINQSSTDFIGLTRPMVIDYRVGLLDNIDIIIELYNKEYDIDNETAVIIDNISIDNIDIIPRFDYLANYVNDHNNNDPTNYLGFNGAWQLNIDQPFYHWLHEHTGQGWLIK
jgi:hypothetical protein